MIFLFFTILLLAIEIVNISKTVFQLGYQSYKSIKYGFKRKQNVYIILMNEFLPEAMIRKNCINLSPMEFCFNVL